MFLLGANPITDKNGFSLELMFETALNTARGDIPKKGGSLPHADVYLDVYSMWNGVRSENEQ